MKMIVAGGRFFEPHKDDGRALIQYVVSQQITRILTGGAPGANRFGEKIAAMLGIPVTVIPADWASHGCKAGPMRNRLLAEMADICWLFPGGRGTESMRREARRAGIPVLEFDRKRGE